MIKLCVKDYIIRKYHIFHIFSGSNFQVISENAESKA